MLRYGERFFYFLYFLNDSIPLKNRFAELDRTAPVSFWGDVRRAKHRATQLRFVCGRLREKEREREREREMDNFHIYEEIGGGKSSTVFKGRRKRSVEYVAIKSIDKEGAMAKILHEVRDDVSSRSSQLPSIL